ncbi:MAG TPA: hypothetical protein VGL53_13855 [Bryobacteraceae bacterium]|jgi:hypothetical protein
MSNSNPGVRRPIDVRGLLLTVAAAAGLPFSSFGAEPQLPTVYSAAVETMQPGGPLVSRKIDRDGPRVTVERSTSLPFQAHGRQSPTPSTRVYYNLDFRRWFSTDLNYGPSISPNLPISSSPNCRAGTFDGTWGDPFIQSARLLSAVNQRSPSQTGTATLNGFSTRILETSTGNQKMKIWLDDATHGLVVRADIDGRTVFNVKRLTLAEPKASSFVPPTYCDFAAH